MLNYENDPEFLFSIIIVEKMNRERMFVLERILSICFPKLIISLDYSIGICQIKPSTAKQVVNCNDYELIKLLINKKSNIDIMCKLIKHYKSYFATNEEVLNYYLTGTSFPKINYELKIYQKLTKWSSKNKFYSKFIEKIDE